MRIMLIVDDTEKQNVLERSIKKRGHVTHITVTLENALDAFGEAHIDMVMCSHCLQDINGFDFVQRARSLDLGRYLYIVMIIDKDRQDLMKEALAKGADDVLIWPADESRMMATIATAVRIITLENELTQKLLAIKRNYSQTVKSFTQLIEAYSEKLAAHCRRVGDLALSMAKMHPGITPDDYPVIEACGLLHDIGMVGLPVTLVDKRRTEFTGIENELYRSHPQRGAAVLNQMDWLRPVGRMIRMHHEQFNGRGFPEALSSDEIPLAAAIVGAASIYDDLLFREHVSREEVSMHLQQHRGYQLAPDLVDVLSELNFSLIQADAQEKDSSCHVVELKEGMVLSRDIVTKSGACVMSTGTHLDAMMITKLKRYYESGNIMARAFIKK